MQNYVALDIRISLSLSGVDIIIQRDFLNNSFTQDPHKHAHPDYEFQYVESGAVTLVFGDEKQYCPRGSVILIPPKFPHLIVSNEEDAVTRTFFYRPVSVENSASLIGSIAVQKPLCIINLNLPFEGIILAIKNELRQKGVFYRERVQGYLIILLADVASAMDVSSDNVENEKQEYRAQVIEDYIVTHCFEDHASLKELAELLHLSPRQLHRQCIRYFNVPFRTKLYQTRMEIAKYQLEMGNKTVA